MQCVSTHVALGLHIQACDNGPTELCGPFAAVDAAVEWRWDNHPSPHVSGARAPLRRARPACSACYNCVLLLS